MFSHKRNRAKNGSQHKKLSQVALWNDRSQLGKVPHPSGERYGGRQKEAGGRTPGQERESEEVKGGTVNIRKFFGN